MNAAAPDIGTAPVKGAHRFAMLDGWRAVSIQLVMAGHLLPLGPRMWGLNGTFAATGMALFFTLSGFLITRTLSEQGADLRVFIIRRFFRIVPLAWLAMAIALTMAGAGPEAWAANFLFYANLPPFWLVPTASHLWSLCVEMQFYVGIALLVAVAGRRGLYAIPLLCLAVTGARIATGTTISIISWLRVDEILAGGTIALLYAGWFGPWPMRLIKRINVYVMIPLVLFAGHYMAGDFAYLRPYLAATTVAASIVNAPPSLARLFESRWAGYIATVSYALYIIHGVLRMTWLGTGDQAIKYIKRPLLFAVIFGLAHISTFWFEQPCIAFAKRLTRRFQVKVVA
jgi:peptidoglycan/LPS O-acetylase OafA/YrhL